LDDLASFAVNFQKTVASMPVFIDKPHQFFLERFHSEGIPLPVICPLDIDQAELAN
jgi:hypothetical protein